jgi:hypothetical protein
MLALLKAPGDELRELLGEMMVEGVAVEPSTR